VTIVVTGASGLLGSEFVAAGVRRAAEIVGLTRAELDVTDLGATRRVIADTGPAWIVHCAAYTAVDRAEAEPEEAMRVNHGGTINVVSAAAEAGARLFYVSTDYVFDGAKGSPYRPDDPVAPGSVYARSKRAGEEAVLGAGGVIARTGWLYGSGGRNFVEAILDRAERGESLRVVDDQRGRPTWARNVAEVVLDLIARDVEDGIWHVADAGEATWLDFAREAVAIRGLDTTIEGVSTKAWGAPAPRPKYSVLDLRRTEEAVGRPMMEWRQALRRYLAENR